MRAHSGLERPLAEKYGVVENTSTFQNVTHT